MNESTLEEMKQMTFYGMHNAFKTAIEKGKTDPLTADQLVGLLIECEYDDRVSRNISRRITNAKFRYKADLETINYQEQNNAICWMFFYQKGENLLVTGSTGVGKSYLASAIGHHACSLSYKVMYFNSAKLFAKMKMAKADGSYIKEMAKIERQNLIVLDDFGMQPLDSQTRLILMDMVEDRHAKNAMIITSQLPVEAWHDIIGEKTIADAIMDRIVYNSHRFRT